MLSHDQARSLAIENVTRAHGVPCDVIDEVTLEKSFGWIMLCQARDWLADRAAARPLAHNGPLIVERATGAVIRYADTHDLDQCLRHYESGFKFETYELTVLAAPDPAKAAYYLLDLGLVHDAPGPAVETERQAPRRFTHRQLHARLAALPATFTGGMLHPVLDTFVRLDMAECCAYRLHGRRPGHAERHLVRERTRLAPGSRP